MKHALPIPVALLAASWPGAGLAQAALEQPPAFVQILDAHREQMDRAIRRRCLDELADGGIVVCGRSIENQRQAVPFPETREPGARVRLIAGEPPGAAAALAAGGSCCGAGGGLDVVGIANAVGRGIGRILHPD